MEGKIVASPQPASADQPGPCGRTEEQRATVAANAESEDKINHGSRLQGAHINSRHLQAI